jgi:diaminopimelate decarboxylase
MSADEPTTAGDGPGVSGAEPVTFAGHSTVTAFGTERGRLTVGGIPVDLLAERVGGTPFFAYDRGLIDARVARVRAHLPDGVGLSYAVKANPMTALVQHLAGLVDGFDVASAGELTVALNTPMPPQRVSFAGPGKSVPELRRAVAAGITVEIESATEGRRLVGLGADLGVRPRAAVRVNPDFEVKGSGMRMGGGAQQFGVDAEQVPALLAELSGEDIELLGFHVFAGSQNLRADVLAEAQQRTVDLVARLADGLPGPVHYLNLGGGFGIPYFARDTPLDLAVVGENLHGLMPRIRELFPQARVAIELGRYLVGEAGVYLTRVLDRKRSRGRDYLVVDGGMQHQLGASGNLGQVLRRNYPVMLAERMDDPADGQVSVVGNLCTPLDLLADKVRLPRAEIGDLVAVFQAGAYGLTASPTGFLSHPVPPEVIL